MYVCMYVYIYVSCPYDNLQSSRYTKSINGYRKLTLTNLQYNGFFRNDVIFSPWNHDAIA